MNIQSNVRQTRSRTRAIEQANANLISPVDDDRMISRASEDSFIPSMIDNAGGELRDCGACNRLNNSELFIVQCQKCSLWYHFSCANVSTATMRTVNFICGKCVNREEFVPPSSVISGVSSSSSARRARLERELQLMEEEKKLLEDLSREKMNMERELRERELREREFQEKLEREKQFIIRKHALLIRQEDDEEKSVRSMRSSQRSTKRTEDWVMQAGSGVGSGKDTVEPIHASTSVNTSHPVEASLVNTQELHPSSTPLKPAIESHPLGCAINTNTGSEVKSISINLGSITIEDSEDSVDGAVGLDPKSESNQNPSNLPFVDLQPYEDILKIEEIPQSGTIAKDTRFGGHCYKRWSAETGELRRQNTLHQQQQTNTERRVIQELMVKHQTDIDTRRKREMELVRQISRLEKQHAGELRQARETEHDLRAQIESHDVEKAALEAKIKSLETQHVVEKDRFRKSEADMRNQLERSERECKALQLQLAELEIEIQNLREMEQQLNDRLEAARRSEEEATRQWREAEKDYWELHDEVEQVIKRNGESFTDSSSPPLLPPPATWLESNTLSTERFDHSEKNPSFPPPPPWVSDNNGFSEEHREFSPQSGGIFNINPLIPCASNMAHACPPFPQQLSSQFLVPPNGSGFGPSPQQLAARQVVTKELPTFSGDPIDWPMFISSYQHSTEACGYSNSENLLRLQRSLRGSAKDSVSSFLLHPSTVPQVMSTLQQLYGRPEQIVNNMIAKVRATPPPKPDRLETLVSFGLVVQNLCGHLKAVGLERHLANPILLQELVDKLPATVKFSWALHQQQVPVVDLNVFSDYMVRISSAASGVTQLAGALQKPAKEERNRHKEKSFVNTHVSTEQPKATHREEAEKVGPYGGPKVGPKEKDARKNSSRWCNVCSVDNHQVESCTAFKGLDLDGRWKAVKSHKLCARCLTSHARWPCKGEVCDDCPKRHHRLLHFDPPAKTTNAIVTVHRQLSSSTLFRILPVTLYGSKGRLDTYEFLDDGSSVTLVERSIADALGVRGETETLRI